MREHEFKFDKKADLGSIVFLIREMEVKPCDYYIKSLREINKRKRPRYKEIWLDNGERFKLLPARVPDISRYIVTANKELAKRLHSLLSND